MMVAIERPMVREATLADLGAMRGLLADVGLGTESLLVPSSRYWVAEDSQGALVGVVGIELAMHAALLRSLGVHPHWRGHGLGSLLVQRIVSVARELTYLRVYLFSTGANSYWTRQGFREVPADELVAALPHAPQVRLYTKKGYLTSEVAWRLEL